MALRFNEGAYGEAYQQGLENELMNRNQPLETLALLGKGVRDYKEGQRQKTQDERDRQLYEMQLDEAQRARKFEETPWEQLLSRNAISRPVSLMPSFEQAPVAQGEGGMGQQPGMPRRSLIDQFRSGEWKNRISQPPQVDMSSQALAQPDLSSLGIPPEFLKLTPRQTASMKPLFEARKYAAAGDSDLPKSIDEILANKVSKGEMGLEEAYQLKNRYTPAMGTLDFKKEQLTQKEEAERQKRESALATQRQDALAVIAKIDEAEKMVSGFSAGAGAFTEGTPILGQMTGATDLAAAIESIQSSLGLNKLMELKSASKAGASGLGALSDREMNLLVSAISSLKQSQNPEQLKTNLRKIKTHYQNILKMNEGINPFGGSEGSDGGSPQDDPLGIRS